MAVQHLPGPSKLPGHVPGGIMKALAVSIMLALIAPLAFAAEESYRSVMPDGSIRYGAAPEPGAKQVKKIAPPPATTGTIVVTNQEKDKAARATTQEGAAGALLPSTRESPKPATAGRLQTPAGLPKRGGYQ